MIRGSLHIHLASPAGRAELDDKVARARVWRNRSQTNGSRSTYRSCYCTHRVEAFVETVFHPRCGQGVVAYISPSLAEGSCFVATVSRPVRQPSRPGRVRSEDIWKGHGANLAHLISHCGSCAPYHCIAEWSGCSAGRLLWLATIDSSARLQTALSTVSRSVLSAL